MANSSGPDRGGSAWLWRPRWSGSLAVIVTLYTLLSGCDGGGAAEPGLDVVDASAPDSQDIGLGGPTWEDPGTGLTWMVDPIEAKTDWDSARDHCQYLSLEGGGWRVPSIDELRTLVTGCPASAAGGPCNIGSQECYQWSCRNDACDGCPAQEGPGVGGTYWVDGLRGDCCWYWSSSKSNNAYYPWGIHFDTGEVGVINATNWEHVRCVRGP